MDSEGRKLSARQGEHFKDSDPMNDPDTRFSSTARLPAELEKENSALKELFSRKSLIRHSTDEAFGISIYFAWLLRYFS